MSNFIHAPFDFFIWCIWLSPLSLSRYNSDVYPYDSGNNLLLLIFVPLIQWIVVVVKSWLKGFFAEYIVLIVEL